MSVINVVMAADRTAFQQTSTVLASLLRRTKKNVSARIYLRGIEADSFTAGRLEVEFITLREEFPGDYPAHVSASAFDRLLAIRDCVAWDRAMILDYDQLVFADIWELYNIPMDDCFVAARTGPEPLDVTSWNWFRRKLPSKYLKHGSNAFPYNGLLLNLRLMREETFWSRLIAVHAEIGLEEQISFAIAVDNRIRNIDKKWNLIPDWDLGPCPERIEGIVHWTGPQKPWNGRGWRPHLWKAEELSWEKLREGNWGRGSEKQGSQAVGTQLQSWHRPNARVRHRQHLAPVNLALSSHPAKFGLLSTVIASALRRTSRPVNVCVFCRGALPNDFSHGHLSVRFLAANLAPGSHCIEGMENPDNDALLAIRDCNTWRKALVLTSDHLVLCDLAELFDIPLNGCLLAGRVWHHDLGYICSNWFGKPLPDQFSKSACGPYYYYGPLLNLENMRHEGTWERFVRIREELKMNDQIALALTAGDKLHKLPAKWNIIPTFDIKSESERPGAVIHWADSSKPWRGHGWCPSLWYQEETSWDELRSGCWTRPPKAIELEVGT